VRGRGEADVRLVVTSEYHFHRHEDGTVTTDAVYPAPYWRRYLGAFDEVEVVARVGDRATAAGIAAESTGVRFVALPDARGLAQVAAVSPRSLMLVASAVRGADAVVLRVPGVIAMLGWLAARLCRIPYGVEVVGDPAESLEDAGGSLVAKLARRALRAQVRGAVASTFVTGKTLQARYPPAPGRTSIAVSDVELPDDIFVIPPPATSSDPELRIAFVGVLHQHYKGLDWLLVALTQTRFRHTLTVIGDGPLRTHLEQMARRLGLADRARFVGLLPGPDAVRVVLAAHDLYVLPSRTEGMPRALLEAMAVGLPCLGTPVGGVPELLRAPDLIPVDRPDVLARAIDARAADPKGRELAARRNREVARSYRISERDRRLRDFHSAMAVAARRRRRGD
jgi:phosphatidyl-myo-inositol dimannoside synthase